MGRILGFLALGGLAVVFYREYQNLQKSKKLNKLIRTKREEEDNLE
jgi:hypothetical protein